MWCLEGASQPGSAQGEVEHLKPFCSYPPARVVKQGAGHRQLTEANVRHSLPERNRTDLHGACSVSC